MLSDNVDLGDFNRTRNRTDVLSRRLISSAVVITAVLLLMWLDHWIGRSPAPTRPGVVLAVVLLIVAVVGGEELRRMIPVGPHRPHAITILIAVLLSTMLSCMPVLFPGHMEDCMVGKFGWTAMGWAAAAGWAFLVEMLRYRANEQALERIVRTIFIAIYIGMLSFLAQLRFLFDNSWGLVAVLSLVVTVKMSDSLAYLIGRWIGKRKLTPVLSPGKTVEGGIAAIVFGVLGALLVFYPVAYWLTGTIGRTTLLNAIVFGAVVSIVGIWGDLVESLIKRESECKDSGALIPGMGGVLDVFDSILGAAPIAFGLWAIGLFGPLE